MTPFKFHFFIVLSYYLLDKVLKGVSIKLNGESFFIAFLANFVGIRFLDLFA